MGKRTAARLVHDITRDVWRHPGNRGRRGRALLRVAAWQAYKRLVRRPFVARVYGLKVWMQPGSGSCSNFAYFGERFEYDQVAFVQRILRPGDAVVDGGANIGAYTLLFASLVGDDGHVDAFEPIPRTAGWLRANIALNGLSFVTAHQAALAAVEGTARFTVGSDVSNERVYGELSSGTVDVATERLAHVLDLGPTMLVKLDLEGGELGALLGAGAHLGDGNPAVLMVELMEWQLRKQGASVADVCALLTEAGYRIGLYDADRDVLTYLDRQLEIGENNVVAVHASRAALVESRGIRTVTA
jgi:FkbM family methyltransferase